MTRLVRPTLVVVLRFIGVAAAFHLAARPRPARQLEPPGNGLVAVGFVSSISEMPGETNGVSGRCKE
jgi:hypothetical protein